MPLETWNIDLAASTVGFTVRHLMVSKVRGRFARWTGTLAFDGASPEGSRVEADIDVASVETGDAARDAFLRTDEVLLAATFPRMTFRSTAVSGGRGELEVRGELTLRGVARPVVLEVTYAPRDARAERLVFSARGSLRRKDFGVSFNAVVDAGGVAVSDKVDLELEVHAARAT